MKMVALYTHRFLESTHYAIAHLLDALTEWRFRVFAKHFLDNPVTRGLRGIDSQHVCVFGNTHRSVPYTCRLIHAIFDGDTAFEAGGAAMRCRLPFVLSFHGGFDTNAKLRDPRYTERSVLLANSANAITVVSSRDESLLREIGITAPIWVLPVAVDFSMLPKLDRSPNATSLIAVGRLIEKKGFDVAIRALSGLPQEFRLTIVGDGPERSALESLCRQLGIANRVRFTGELPLGETLREMLDHSVLVHPARCASDGNSEGTPHIVLLAQAMGIPVVASNAGSLGEIVDDTTGIVIIQGDDRALARSVLHLAANSGLRQMIIGEANQRVRRTHSIERVKASVEDIYTELQGQYCRSSSGRHRLYWGSLPKHERVRAELDLRGAVAEYSVGQRSVEFAGEGGQGVLFACFGIQEDAVCVKLPRSLPSDVIGELQSVSILREVRCLTALQPDLAPRLIAWHPKGRYLIREFVVGNTLSSLVRGVLADDERLELAKIVADYGLRLFRKVHLDVRGPFVIRDFKAANLIVPLGTPSKVVQVDFGSVKSVSALRATGPHLGRAGSGRWLHWPPEELHDLGPASRGQWADFFALGVTLYTVLFGASPFSNSIADPIEAQAIYGREYRSASQRLSTLRAATPDVGGLLSLVEQCIDPDPLKRVELQLLMYGSHASVS